MDLDTKRNRNREALNALKHDVADSGEYPLPAELCNKKSETREAVKSTKPHSERRARCKVYFMCVYAWNDIKRCSHLQRKSRFAWEACLSNSPKPRQERWFRKVKHYQVIESCTYTILLRAHHPKLFWSLLWCVDQEQLDKEINDLRKGLKAKVNRLNEMQGK